MSYDISEPLCNCPQRAGAWGIEHEPWCMVWLLPNGGFEDAKEEADRPHEDSKDYVVRRSLEDLERAVVEAAREELKADDLWRRTHGDNPQYDGRLKSLHYAQEKRVAAVRALEEAGIVKESLTEKRESLSKCPSCGMMATEEHIEGCGHLD